MADNVTADAGSGGAIFAAASLSFSGDTAVVPLNALGILSGSEGSWTYTLYPGGAGAVSAGTPRVTLASDDPAVVALQILDNAISGSEMQVDVVGALPAGTNAIGKLAANSGVDIGDVDVLSIAAGDNNIGNVDIVTVPADPFGANADAASATGSISAKLRFIAATGIPITGTVTVGSHAVTNAGTFVVQVDGTALTRLTDIETNTDSLAVVGNGAAATAQRVTLASDSTGIVSLTTSTASIGKLAANSGVDIGDVDILSIAAGDNNIGNVDIVSLPASTNTIEVVGDAAHDAAVAGNPVRVGARADTALSGITLVADGDTTDLYAGADGVLIVRSHTCLEDVVQERDTNTDGASTAFDGGLAAPGANIRLWITQVTICNSSASFCTVDLRDGAAGAVLWTLPVPATGGVVQQFNPPLKLTANTALAYDASAATSTLTISGNGFKSKL